MFLLNLAGFVNGAFLIISFWYLARTERMSFVNEPFSNLLSKEMHPRTAKTAKMILFLFLISQYLFFINLILRIGAGNIWESIIALSISTIAGVVLTLRPPTGHKYDLHHSSAVICLGLMSLGGAILNLKLIYLNTFFDISLTSLIIALVMILALIYWSQRQKLNAEQESVILTLLSLWNISMSRLFFLSG